MIDITHTMILARTHRPLDHPIRVRIPFSSSSNNNSNSSSSKESTPTWTLMQRMIGVRQCTTDKTGPVMTRFQRVERRPTRMTVMCGVIPDHQNEQLGALTLTRTTIILINPRSRRNRTLMRGRIPSSSNRSSSTCRSRSICNRKCKCTLSLSCRLSINIISRYLSNFSLNNNPNPNSSRNNSRSSSRSFSNNSACSRLVLGMIPLPRNPPSRNHQSPDQAPPQEQAAEVEDLEDHPKCQSTTRS